MDALIRLAVLVSVGCLLLVLNVWFVRHAIDGFKPRALPDTIAPIHVVGVEDKDGKAGQALAGMLLARMRHIGAEMAATHEQLKRPLAERGPGDQGLVLPQDLRNAPPDGLPSGLAQTLNLEMKVAGVEVGGVLSWMHRSMTSDNALQLTLQNGNGGAVVSGTWNEGRDTLWVEVPGAADKLVPNERIVKSVAYALMQRQFERQVPEVSALSPAEFETFVATMAEAATKHRQAVLGGAFQPEFAALSDTFEKLVVRAPNWKELVHFAARLAELGGKSDLALDRYKQTLALLDKGSGLHEPIQARLVALTERLVATAPPTALPAAPPVSAASTASASAAGATPVAGKASGPRVAARLAQWPLQALGVDGLAMPGAVRVAVLGGPPADGTLREGQFEIVGPDGGAGAVRDPMMADYVRNIVQTVLMVAPRAHFVFAHSQSRNGAATEGQILAELAALAQARPAVALVTLGPLRSAAYARLFEQMAAAGTLVVMAAGNDPQRAMLSLGPALDEQVLIVSSVGPAGKPSAFTQSGAHSVWAPGENIPLRSATGARTDAGAGTSYAAALAAGVAARLVAERPTLAPRALRQTLVTTAQSQAGGGPAVLNLARARGAAG